MYDRRNHAKRLLFGGLLLGNFAALLIALVELVYLLVGASGARLEGAPARVLLYDVLVVLLAGPFLGIVFGGGVSAVHLIAVRFAGQRQLEPMWKARLYTLAAVPAVAWIVNQAFLGPRARQIPARPFIAAGLGALLLGGVYGGSRVVIYVAQRLAVGHASRPLRFAAAPILLAVTGALYVADQLVLPRLYPFFHWSLAVLTALAGWMTFGALHLSFGNRLRRAFGRLAKPLTTGILCLVVFVMGLLGHRLAGGSHRLRGLLFERTRLAAKIMAVSSRVGLLPRPEPLAATRPSPHRRPPPRRAAPVLRGADVVLITVDALRADRLGLAGYGRPRGGKRQSITPNIDRFFGKGVTFQRAYATTPRTSYSLVSLLTGVPIHTLSQLGIERRWPTLPEVLARRGRYTTAGFYPSAIFTIDSQRFTQYRVEHLGFQSFRFENEDLSARKRTDQVIQYLERGAKAKRLLLWAHYFDPHEPYRARKGYRSFGRSPAARYDAEIAYVDAQIGRLIMAVRKRRKRAIFVLAADHGEEFGEHGGTNHGTTLFEEQIRVPLLMAGPGLPKRTVTQPVSIRRVAATVLRLVGVSAAGPMGSGRSLTEFFSGPVRWPPAVFADVDQRRMIVLGHHKLIQDRHRNYLSLYDLKRDPRERHPLDIDRPGAARKRASVLLGHLERRLRQIERLRSFGRVAGLGPLASALTAADGERRRRAASAALEQALRGPLDRRTRGALKRVLKDADPEVRHRALLALALHSETPLAGARLDRVLRLAKRWDLPAELRYAAGLVLARAGHPDAQVPLAELLQEPADLDRRLALIRALADLGRVNAEGVDALQSLLGDGESVLAVLRALVRLRQSPEVADAVTLAVPEVYRVLPRYPEHLGHRAAALATLACMETTRASELLARWLPREGNAGLRAFGLALLAHRPRPTEHPPALLRPLPGPGVEAPAGACLAGDGCRLEAAPVTVTWDDTAARRGPRALWLVLEAKPKSLPQVRVGTREVVPRVVPMFRPSGPGPLRGCGRAAGLRVLRVDLPAAAADRSRGSVTLRDPSGKGLWVRALAILPSAAPAPGAPPLPGSPGDAMESSPP